ncbi:MAG: hypothetical protein ACRELG_11355 [Gemmataceae bacterium]
MKICLADNDVIHKLAAFDLFEEALAALGLGRQDVYVLPTAKHKFGVTKDLAKAEKKYGAEVFAKIRDFLASVREIQVPIPPEEQKLFDDVVEIDAGEAVLFSATIHFQDFLLATGDKRSLRALTASVACQPIARRLQGHVICFEQIILRLIDRFGFECIRNKVVPARACDTVMRAVFGSGLSATEANVREGLDSYLGELRALSIDLLIR